MGVRDIFVNHFKGTLGLFAPINWDRPLLNCQINREIKKEDGQGRPRGVSRWVGGCDGKGRGSDFLRSLALILQLASHRLVRAQEGRSQIEKVDSLVSSETSALARFSPPLRLLIRKPRFFPCFLISLLPSISLAVYLSSLSGPTN